MNNLIVSKFGGSSLSDAQSIRAVAKIVLSNPSRRVIVLSAPGRRHQSDPKITDLLIQRQFEAVISRFTQIASELNCPNSQILINSLASQLESSTDQEWIISRGEWLMAQIFAEFIQGTFLDSTELIIINNDRTINQKSFENIQTPPKAILVIPGFYGSSTDGKILTFPRNGSDISGAVLANKYNANVYEVWTDVDGVMTHDPNSSSQAQFIPLLTLEEMMRMDAQVLHPDATLPLAESGVPINIKNTFNPAHPGTWIVDSLPQFQPPNLNLIP